jgi:hypothetical protein
MAVNHLFREMAVYDFKTNNLSHNRQGGGFGIQVRNDSAWRTVDAD